MVKTWVDRKGRIRAFVGGKEIPNLVSISATSLSHTEMRSDRAIPEPNRNCRYNLTLELNNVRVERVSRKPR